MTLVNHLLSLEEGQTSANPTFISSLNYTSQQPFADLDDELWI